MKYIAFISMMMFIFLAGCSRESELEKSVYITDPDTDGLPKYSEWGYNTFGAYYDRAIFVSTNGQVPAKVISSDTATQLIFEGQKYVIDYYGVNYADGVDMTMTFTFSGLICNTFNDLVALNDSIVDLTDPGCHLSFHNAEGEMPVKVIGGHMTIHRAQNLMVDKQPVETILSGYFDLQLLVDGKPVTISDGRFDVGIGADNFYFY